MLSARSIHLAGVENCALVEVSAVDSCELDGSDLRFTLRCFDIVQRFNLNSCGLLEHDARVAFPDRVSDACAGPIARTSGGRSRKVKKVMRT